jgi:hypothetical protein
MPGYNGKEGKMKEIVAYCGVVCSECPTYQVTQNNDNEARSKIAAEWSQRYKMSVKPEAVVCDGCLAVGKRLIGYCNVCEIRKCGMDNKVLNCGYCKEYPCDRLNKVHKISKNARDRLDAIRKSISDKA